MLYDQLNIKQYLGYNADFSGDLWQWKLKHAHHELSNGSSQGTYNYMPFLTSTTPYRKAIRVFNFQGSVCLWLLREKQRSRMSRWRAASFLLFISLSQVSVKQPSCDNPVTHQPLILSPHSILLETPLWRILISSLRPICNDKTCSFQASTPDLWLWVLLHPKQLLPSLDPVNVLSVPSYFSSFVLSLLICVIFKWINVFVIDPLIPCPSALIINHLHDLHACGFVSDTFNRVAMPFPLMLHGWLKPSVAPDPYCWQHFTLTPLSALIFPP